MAPPTGQDESECSNNSKNPTQANLMEKQIGELDTKVKRLYFKLSQTNEIVEKHEQQSLESHQSLITSIVNAVDMLKSAVEEKKFTEEESKDAIKTWSAEIEKHLEKADQGTKRGHCAVQVIDMEEQEKRALENHKQQMNLMNLTRAQLRP